MANIPTCRLRGSRRDFLRSGFFGVGIGASMPLVFRHSALEVAAQSFLEDKEAHPERILVVVELAGGNDGLNTVIPYGNDTYYKLRPRLAIRAADVLKLNPRAGLHPSMTGFRALWDQGQLAIVEGCGYPNPNRSHFTSMEYWHTGVPNAPESLGWVGRFADSFWRQPAAGRIVNIAERQSLAVQSDRHAPIVFSDPNRYVRAGDPAQESLYRNILERDTVQANRTLTFLRGIARTAADTSVKVRQAVRDYRTPVSYGSESSVSTLSTDLKKVAALIHAGFPTRIYYAGIGGFDTHASQPGAQQGLLMYVADAIEGFCKDLKRIGRSADVAVMMFTEFGRRVAENQSAGTDHGTATPMYIVGEKVRGGFYGAHPSLEELDSNGDLKMTTDFRRVYATMLQEWIGYGDSRAVLRGDFPGLGVFAGRG